MVAFPLSGAFYIYLVNAKTVILKNPIMVNTPLILT